MLCIIPQQVSLRRTVMFLLVSHLVKDLEFMLRFTTSFGIWQSELVVFRFLLPFLDLSSQVHILSREPLVGCLPFSPTAPVSSAMLIACFLASRASRSASTGASSTYPAQHMYLLSSLDLCFTKAQSYIEYGSSQLTSTSHGPCESSLILSMLIIVDSDNHGQPVAGSSHLHGAPTSGLSSNFHAISQSDIDQAVQPC